MTMYSLVAHIDFVNIFINTSMGVYFVHIVKIPFDFELSRTVLQSSLECEYVDTNFLFAELFAQRSPSVVRSVLHTSAVSVSSGSPLALVDSLL